MNKKLSPGRIYSVNGIVVRAKRQYNCNGCIFNNPFSCPRVKDLKNLNEESGEDKILTTEVTEETIAIMH